ncbi:phage major capsid protein, P2 family [Uliginosibacterium gangwonense]|uniref:phage major capsid protein, P2 family n=1 Tax=Uliginosibacterium gangwonense TaxID=392736 RepID=UPI00037BDE9A|nr:phage major capsid protein, P2 family [Uliginosibacterium gangwonense]
MRNETRKVFNAFTAQVATLNGVPNAAEKFAVTPTVQQKLETKMQESSAFLQKINIMGVTEQSGQILGLGVGGPIASRTDTTQKERSTRDITTMDERGYQCVQTNYDTHLTYAKLDAWAKFPDFQTRIRDLIVTRQALDRIMIGWNGVRAAVETDLTKNPLLQDVNKGWLQLIREYSNGALFMTEAKAGSGTVKIGNSVDKYDGYKNLDALVMHLVSNNIKPWHREDPGLVVIMGRGLLEDKYFPLVNRDQRATDVLATDVIMSQKRVGGLQAVTVPFFPENTLLVTRLDNLSIYYQEGGRRRAVLDEPKRDRIANYESSNDAYVIENYECIAAAENIQIIEDPASQGNAATAPASTATTGA